MDSSRQKPVSRRKRAASGLFAGFGTTGVTMLVSFVVTPVILRFLGREAYGTWAIIAQLVGYVTVVDIGMGSGVQAYVSQLAHKGDKQTLGQILSTGVLVELLFGVVFIGIGLALLPFLSHLVGAENVPLSIIRFTFVVAVFSRAFQALVSVFEMYLMGHQFIATCQYIGLGACLLQSGLMVVLMYFGFGLLALPYSMLASEVATLLVELVLMRRLTPGARCSPRLVRKAWLKKLVNFSAWGVAGRAASHLVHNTDNLVIGHFLGASQVTTYVLTRRLPELVRLQLVDRIVRAVRPGLGDLFGRGQFGPLQRTFTQGMRAFLAFSVCSALLIGFVAERFLALWVGPINYGGPVLVVVTAATLVVGSLFRWSAAVLSAALDVKSIALVRLVEGVLNLGLSISFVKMGLGLVGVALGTLVSSALTSSGYLTLRALRACRMGVGGFVRDVLPRTLVLAVAMATTCRLLAACQPLARTSWWSLGGYVALAGLAALAWCILLGLDRGERIALHTTLVRRMTRAKALPADGLP